MRNGLIVYADGTKEWYLNDKLHREEGPAAEWSNGHKVWCLNGKLHREDGPAVEYINGSKRWYLNGKDYLEEEHRKIMKKQNSFFRRLIKRLFNY